MVKRKINRRKPLPKRLKDKAKKCGIRLTVKRNGKRVYKTEKILRTQIKRKEMMKAKKKTVRRRKKSRFGARKNHYKELRERQQKQLKRLPLYLLGVGALGVGVAEAEYKWNEIKCLKIISEEFSNILGKDIVDKVLKTSYAEDKKIVNRIEKELIVKINPLSFGLYNSRKTGRKIEVERALPTKRDIDIFIDNLSSGETALGRTSLINKCKMKKGAQKRVVLKLNLLLLLTRVRINYGFDERVNHILNSILVPHSADILYEYFEKK